MASGGVNIKMGVTGVADFKRDINAARQQIKTMDADLALVEKQFKATGDAEAYMQQKTELLKGKLDAQKNALEKAEAALKTMKDNGVSPASAAFQEMQRKVIETKSGLIDTETALKNVGTSSDGTNESLRNIDRGVAFENITNGLDKVISKLESGAKAAINFGKKIVRSAMDSTGWADEVLTEATKYGVDADTIQRMRNVAEFIDTDVETILNAKARLAKNKDSLPELMGFGADGMSVDEAFWKAGEAIMAMTDEFQREEAAQAVFGRGWKELVPLFTAGQEEYNRLMAEQNVLTNEQVANLGKADDAIKSVQQQIEMMKNQFWAENADKIVEMGQWIIDNKEGLVTALGAIAAGFGALKLADVALNIAKTVNGFKTLWEGAHKPLPNMTGLGGGNGVSQTVSKAGGVGGTALLGKAGSALTPWLVPAAVVTAAVAPAMIAQGEDEKRWAQQKADRLAAADMLSGGDAAFMRRSADVMDQIHRWTDDPFQLLMGLQDRGAEQKALLFSMLAGQGTSYGNYATNELLDLWKTGGEGWDQARLDALLTTVSESYERMAEQTGEVTGATESQNAATKDMTDAAREMQKLPAEVKAAVISGMSGVTISIDGQTAGSVLAPYVGGSLGLMVLNNP